MDLWKDSDPNKRLKSKRQPKPRAKQLLKPCYPGAVPIYSVNLSPAALQVAPAGKNPHFRPGLVHPGVQAVQPAMQFIPQYHPYGMPISAFPWQPMYHVNQYVPHLTPYSLQPLLDYQNPVIPFQLQQQHSTTRLEKRGWNAQAYDSFLSDKFEEVYDTVSSVESEDTSDFESDEGIVQVRRKKYRKRMKPRKASKNYANLMMRDASDLIVDELMFKTLLKMLVEDSEASPPLKQRNEQEDLVEEKRPVRQEEDREKVVSEEQEVNMVQLLKEVSDLLVDGRYIIHYVLFSLMILYALHISINIAEMILKDLIKRLLPT